MAKFQQLQIDQVLTTAGQPLESDEAREASETYEFAAKLDCLCPSINRFEVERRKRALRPANARVTATRSGAIDISLS